MCLALEVGLLTGPYTHTKGMASKALSDMRSGEQHRL